MGLSILELMKKNPNPLLEPSEIAVTVATYVSISIFIHNLHSLSKIVGIYFNSVNIALSF